MTDAFAAPMNPSSTPRFRFMTRLYLGLFAAAAFLTSAIITRLPILLFAAVGGSVILYLTVRYEEWAIVSIPLLAVVVDGLAASPLNLGLVVTAILTAKAGFRLLEGRWTLRFHHVAALWLMGWFVVNWVLQSGSVRGGLSTKQFLAFLQVPLVLVVCLVYPIPIWRMMQSLALTGVITSVMLYTAPAEAGARPVVLGLNANYSGALVSLAAICAAVLVYHFRQWRWAVATAICVAGLYPPQSRAAIVAALVGIGVIAVTNRGVATPILLAAILGVTTIGSQEIERFLRDKVVTERDRGEFATSDNRRDEAIDSAYKMFLREPFKGVGQGRFQNDKDNNAGVLAITHNEFVGLPAETGLPPLLVLMGLILWPFFRARRVVMPIVGGPFIALAGLLTKGNYFSDISVGSFMCALIGILWAVADRKELAGPRSRMKMHPSARAMPTLGLSTTLTSPAGAFPSPQYTEQFS